VIGYLEKSKDGLIALLLECIEKVEIEDDEEVDDEWGVQTSAGCCLQKVSQVLGSKIVPQVIPFVTANI
jgi:importin subunit beta-1